MGCAEALLPGKPRHVLKNTHTVRLGFPLIRLTSASVSAPQGDLIILATVCFSVPTVFFFTLFSAYFLFLSLECKLCEDGKEGFSSLGYNFRCFFIISSLWPPIPDGGRHHSQLLSFHNSLGVPMRSLGSESESRFCTLVVLLISCGIMEREQKG